MIDAEIMESTPGHRVIRVVREVWPDGNPKLGCEIPVATLASYRELLGMDDPVEVLEALLDMDERGVDVEPDPVTGKNVYTDAYQLLRLREQAREDAALEVKEHEGHTDYQVQVAAEQMAHRAVHEPIGGGECAMDRCRREARGKLGLPDPARKCGVETRSERPSVPAKQPVQARAMRPAGGKAQALDLLADQADYLQECTRHFLHSLTDHDADPLEPDTDTTPDPEARILTADEILAKYQEAH